MKNNRRNEPLLSRIPALANSIAEACETHRFWLLTAASALYFTVVGLIAAGRQLENDEIFTLYIARLPGMADVWSALLTGAEQLPPFFYVLTRAALWMGGESSLALRLPAILGVWAMSLCLYGFVSRRSTALYGLVAMLFSLTTNACYYAFEARPYGLVLGFSGIALICFQSLAEEKRRMLALVGLALSLAAAVSCHYYAVLLLIPFGLGEVARTLSRRKIDPSVWCALVLSLSPLLVFLPLIEGARSYSSAFWAQPAWANIPDFYYFLLRSAALPIVAIMVLAALYRAVFLHDGREATDDLGFALLRHESALAAGFLAIPFAAVALAMFVTGAFTDRYALPAVLGVSVLLPFALHQLIRGRQILTLLLIILFASGFSRRWDIMLRESADRVQRREAVTQMLEVEDVAGLPIVSSDPHIFLALSYYAPTNVSSRLVYLTDPEGSRRYLGHDSIERGMTDLLKPWFRLNVQQYRPFIASQRPFLLCGDPDYFLNWVLQDLVSLNAQIELRGRHKEFLIFLVNPERAPGLSRNNSVAETEPVTR